MTEINELGAQRHNMVTAQDLLIEPELPNAMGLPNATARIVDGVIYVVRGHGWHRMENEGSQPTTPVPDIPPEPLSPEGHPVELSLNWGFRYVHTTKVAQFLVPAINDEFGEPWVRIAPVQPVVSPSPFDAQDGWLIAEVSGTFAVECLIRDIVDLPASTCIHIWLEQDGYRTHLLAYQRLSGGITYASVAHDDSGPRSYSNEAIIHLVRGQIFRVVATFTAPAELVAASFPKSFTITMGALPIVVSDRTDPDGVVGWDTRVEAGESFFVSHVGAETTTWYLKVQANARGGVGTILAQIVRFVLYSSSGGIDTRSSVSHNAALHDVYTVTNLGVEIALPGITLSDGDEVEVEVVYTIIDQVGTSLAVVTVLDAPSGGIAG